MSEFDYFRNKKDRFNPKTPIAALKAYRTGFLPISVFTYKSGSTKPLDEVPYDIDEIEKLLSRKNLGLETNIVLIGIFEKLIFSEDQEIALFAAESINIIENRYNKKIEDIKNNLETDKSSENYSELGRLFYELAILNKERESIKKFFFRESYRYFSEVRKMRRLRDDELNTLIRILLELKLYMNAADILRKEKTEETVRYLMLKAEIWFAMGNYAETRDILRKVEKSTETLIDKEQSIIDYWLGM
ncbi:MAG: hypothetical protein L3J12_03630 [Spirochaetales bacterium]|nr:hypothetical protein [Spirochaetales bacterium]